MDWTPPPGMTPAVVQSWRAFYASIATRYGISPAQYRGLYLAQQGRCYVCRKAKGIHPDDPKGRGARRLGVDHNHALGNRLEAVRGLLCSGSLSADTCNRLIEKYTPAALQRASDYKAMAPAQRVFLALEGGYGDEEILGMLTR